MLALAFTMSAQSKAGKSKILQPQMTVAPDGGTYQQPMGKLGEKSADPWSATTLGASVDGLLCRRRSARIRTSRSGGRSSSCWTSNW